jgi:signal transduction histidine kinase
VSFSFGGGPPARRIKTMLVATIHTMLSTYGTKPKDVANATPTKSAGEEHKAGVGTHSMRERAEELGGRCTIGAPEGGGTLVSARLPCRTVRDAHRREE